MKRFITLLCVVAALCSCTICSAAYYGTDVEKDNSKEYTLGDVYLQKLINCGLLDSEIYNIECSDNSLKLAEAWDILEKCLTNISETLNNIEQTDDIIASKNDINTLLNTLGVNREDFWSGASVGDSLTLGDLALAIINIDEASSKVNLNIKDEDNIIETQYPKTIIIYTSSIDETISLMEKAIEFIPKYIRIRPSENLTESELFDIYVRLRSAEYDNDSAIYNDKIWENFYGKVEHAPGIEYNTLLDYKRSEDQIKLYRNFKSSYYKMADIGTIDYAQAKYQTEICESLIFGTGSEIKVSMNYTEAWELACDASNKQFTYFSDTEMVNKADKLYENVAKKIKSNSSNYSKLLTAKNYIVSTASYDWNSYKAIVSGTNADYNYNCHNIIGYLTDKTIVCDGYADTFQYLMLRFNIPCIQILGATKYSKSTTIEDMKIDHVWNKVKLEDEWYNIDICWADTVSTPDYDLKSDKYYYGNEHFISDHYTGFFESSINYR